MDFALSFWMVRFMQLTGAASATKWMEEEDVSDYWSTDKATEPTDAELEELLDDFEPGILPPTAGARVRRVVRRIFG